jgi:hypothetical protein
MLRPSSFEARDHLDRDLKVIGSELTYTLRRRAMDDPSFLLCTRMRDDRRSGVRVREKVWKDLRQSPERWIMYRQALVKQRSRSADVQQKILPCKAPDTRGIAEWKGGNPKSVCMLRKLLM